jgi:hypothetical protein
VDKVVDGLVVVIVLVVVIPLMIWAWRRRRARHARYGAAPTPPAELGAVLAESDALYLATTPAERRYERLTVPGLGFRARLHVSVTETGILLPIPGHDHVFIPRGDIIEVGRASWTIDRGTEPDGLVRIAWHLGGEPVDSFFRFDGDDSAAIAAAAGLVGTP